MPLSYENTAIALLNNNATKWVQFKSQFKDQFKSQGFWAGVSFALTILCLSTGLSQAAVPKAPQPVASANTDAPLSGHLNISLLLTSGEQRTAWLQLVSAFERAYPDVTVTSLNLANEPYHEFMESWQTQDMDLLYGFAGKQWLQQRAFVEPVTDLWQQEQWQQAFAPFLSSVRFGEAFYGLPVSYYHWGFYYNRQLLQELNLSPAKDWQSFLDLCAALKAQGIYPFVFNTHTGWASASWFSYLNLRLNGRQFHMDLLAGKQAFDSEPVRQVLRYWKTLIDRDYFLPVKDSSDIRTVLPMLYRKKAAMVLSGNFMSKHLNPRFRSRFAFFAFPVINPEMPIIEETPVDVLFIHKNSRNKAAAKAFLRFVAKPDRLFTLNEQVGYISPHQASAQSSNYFMRVGATTIANADGTTLFLNRDGKKELANYMFDVFRDFALAPDIDATLVRLEAGRKQFLLH